MISKCLNPECGRELNYLRSGRVVRAVRQVDESTHIEHFWLCGDCSSKYEFSFLPDGTVTVSFRNPRERREWVRHPIAAEEREALSA
jgi:hypothetical protein